MLLTTVKKDLKATMMKLKLKISKLKLNQKQCMDSNKVLVFPAVVLEDEVAAVVLEHLEHQMHLIHLEHLLQDLVLAAISVLKVS